MLNRRNLIRSAAGLLVAGTGGLLGAGELWTPETEAKRFYQLDRGRFCGMGG